MTASFTSNQRFPVPVAELFEAHIDPGFQEAKARAFGALAVTASRHDPPATGVTPGTTKIILRIETREPARRGSGTDTGVMTYDLDPTALRGRWSRVQVGFEDKARAEGTITFEAAGPEASMVRVTGEIEIKVPLLGKMIERKIVATIAAEAQKEEAIAGALLLARRRR